MNTRTFYTTRILNTYVNWDGDIQLHCEDDSQIDAKMDLATLKRFSSQLVKRIADMEQDQLKQLREKLEKEAVDNE